MVPAPAEAALRPSVAQALAKLTADDAGWTDEPEVHTAAEAALTDGTTAGAGGIRQRRLVKARTLANQRKDQARKQVQDWGKSGGPKVKE
jgi:hypothetical protein